MPVLGNKRLIQYGDPYGADTGPARGDSLAEPRQSKQINATGVFYTVIKGREGKRRCGQLRAPARLIFDADAGHRVGPDDSCAVSCSWPTKCHNFLHTNTNIFYQQQVVQGTLVVKWNKTGYQLINRHYILN